MMPAAQHHERFYFKLVTILVEDCLFRVPCDTLASQSDVFHDMFLLPVEANEAEGQSDTNPIVLADIKKEDFQSLMKLLFPLPITSLESQDGFPATLGEWTGVLKLSEMWGFTCIHEFAIQQLEILLAERPVDKVALAQDHRITRWLMPGLLELARRAAPMGEEDVEKLGLDTVLKLADVRESVRITTTVSEHGSRIFRAGFQVGLDHPAGTTFITANSPRGPTTCDFTKRIREVFRV